MGRRSLSGGVFTVSGLRIRFDFMFDGVRYRPSLAILPTEMNLRRARAQLKGIKQRITQGTFSFAEEFPDYRFLNRTPNAGSPRTCNQLFDAFLAHCEARHAKHDMAAITLVCAIAASSTGSGVRELARHAFSTCTTQRSLRLLTIRSGARRRTTTRSASCDGHSSSAIATIRANTIQR